MTVWSAGRCVTAGVAVGLTADVAVGMTVGVSATVGATVGVGGACFGVEADVGTGVWVTNTGDGEGFSVLVFTVGVAVGTGELAGADVRDAQDVTRMARNTATNCVRLAGLAIDFNVMLTF